MSGWAGGGTVEGALTVFNSSNVDCLSSLQSCLANATEAEACGAWSCGAGQDALAQKCANSGNTYCTIHASYGDYADKLASNHTPAEFSLSTATCLPAQCTPGHLGAVQRAQMRALCGSDMESCSYELRCTFSLPLVQVLAIVGGCLGVFLLLVAVWWALRRLRAPGQGSVTSEAYLGLSTPKDTQDEETYTVLDDRLPPHGGKVRPPPVQREQSVGNACILTAGAEGL